MVVSRMTKKELIEEIERLERRIAQLEGPSPAGSGAVGSTRDVAEFTKERQMFFDMLETLPVMICIVRPDYHIPFANRAFREVFGESGGRPCYEYVFGQEGPCTFCQTLVALRTNAPHHWECRPPNGRIIDVHDFPFTDLDGTLAVLEMDVDITERIHVEEALRESEEKYRNLFESSMDAILLTQPDGTALDANPAACAMFAMSREEIVRRGRTGLVDGTDPRLRALLRERTTTGRCRGELIMIRSDGQRFPVELTSTLFDDSEGSKKTSMIIRDLTEQKRAEEALAESERRYRTFLDSSTDHVFLKDEKMRYIFANRALLEYAGKTPEELIGTDDFAVLPEGLAPDARRTDEETLRARATMVSEATMGGTTYEVTKFPVPLAGGRTGVGGFARDITERRRAEEQLRLKEWEIETLVNNTGDMIVRFDRGLRHVFVNRALCELAGIPSDEYLYKTNEELGMPDDLCRFWNENLTRVFETNSPHTIEFRFTGQNGIERSFQANISPEAESDGTVRTVVSVVRDVTDLKQMQAELERSRSELRWLAVRLSGVEETQRRSIAGSLHDGLGQHLTALGINLNMIASFLPKRTAVKVMPQISDSLRLIRTAMGEVRHLITDLRNPVLEDYGLLPALEWHCKEFVGRAGITVTFSENCFAGRLDATRERELFRIAQESLSNVVRHARATQVRIALQKDGDTIRLSVADNGTGLPPEKRPDTEDGPALQHWGLLMMRERAVSIGGSLYVESLPGKGTTVVTEVRV